VTVDSDNPTAVDAARGASRLITEAVEQVVTIVEAMHSNIASGAMPIGKGTDGRTRGITGLVYETIRLVNSGVQLSLDASLGVAARAAATGLPAPQWDTVSSILNGVLGDYLEQTGNPLALRMRLRHRGKSLTLGALPPDLCAPGQPVLLGIHGSCMSDQGWTRRGHNHVDSLADQFGMVPLYLRYNSGRHVSQNGRELASLLDALVEALPEPPAELVILVHSMGGLVARSALHYAAASDRGWPALLTKVIFLGTPHHGAPLERGGNWLETIAGKSPYTEPLIRLGTLRSGGVTDLRHGSLLDSDWQGRGRFEAGDDPRTPVPLPSGLACFAAAGSTGAGPHEARDRLVGDGLVPVRSAFGEHDDPARTLAFPASARWLGYGRNHMDLLSDPELYEQLRVWMTAPAK